MKYYLLIFNDDYADEHNVPALEVMTQEEFDKWKETPSGVLNKNYEKELQEFRAKKSYGYFYAPKKLEFSFLYAFLGNGGDNFNDSYKNFYLMKEFIGNCVEVKEISEEFYKTFKKNNLNQLSLCNIFDTEDLIGQAKYND